MMEHGLLRDLVEQACPERRGAIVEIINEARKSVAGKGFEVDAVDSLMEFYALWRLARLYIPNRNGRHDSNAISAYADALCALSREGLFHIESGLGRRVIGRFVESKTWLRLFEWAKGCQPQLWKRLEEALCAN